MVSEVDIPHMYFFLFAFFLSPPSHQQRSRSKRSPYVYTEPRFSLDSDSTANNPSDVSAGSSDFAWDGRRGELRTKTTPVERFEQQRFQPSPKPRRPEPRNSHSTRSSFDRSNEPLYQPIQTKISAGNSNDLAIMKRISVDQQSERISISTDARDDERSQNTASDDDIGSGSFDGEGNWQSSNYETTGLSDAQIRKLLKKGINPNLYAEMKAAKKGKGRWGVGPLLGNSFLG